MITMEFDYEKLIDYEKLAEAMRPIIREEIQELQNERIEVRKLPPMLTVDLFKEVLHIKSWKASELLGRPDFPVLREAGVLVPRDKLFEWIDRNLDWVEDNTGYFRAV